MHYHLSQMSKHCLASSTDPALLLMCLLSKWRLSFRGMTLMVKMVTDHMPIVKCTGCQGRYFTSSSSQSPAVLTTLGWSSASCASVSSAATFSPKIFHRGNQLREMAFQTHRLVPMWCYIFNFSLWSSFLCSERSRSFSSAITSTSNMTATQAARSSGIDFSLPARNFEYFIFVSFLPEFLFSSRFN